MTATLQFFEDTPIDDAPSPAEQPQPIDASAKRPRVVVLASVNGGVGRSTLATALGSGLQRLGRRDGARGCEAIDQGCPFEVFAIRILQPGNEG